MYSPLLRCLIVCASVSSRLLLVVGMRLLRLAQSEIGSSLSRLVVIVVFWPVSPGSWPGGAWVPWRVVPWSGYVFVASDDPES